MASSADFLIVDLPTVGLQRLRAGFSGHAYDRHRHETYAVGVTEAGLQCFHYRGTGRASTAGSVIAIHPDETHDGHARAHGGFTYRMLYADPALIAAALSGCSLPFLREPVFDDPVLRGVIAEAFADFPAPLEDLAAPALVAALADALSRRAGSPQKIARASAATRHSSRPLSPAARPSPRRPTPLASPTRAT
jgi:AraC-like protein